MYGHTAYFTVFQPYCHVANLAVFQLHCHAVNFTVSHTAKLPVSSCYATNFNDLTQQPKNEVYNHRSLKFDPYNTYMASKIVSEYDQEIPQLQTADNHVAPQGRAAQPSRDTRKTK